MKQYFTSYEQDIFTLNHAALIIQHWYYKTRAKFSPSLKETQISIISCSKIKDRVSPTKIPKSEYQKIICTNSAEKSKRKNSEIVQAINGFNKAQKEKLKKAVSRSHAKNDENSYRKFMSSESKKLSSENKKKITKKISMSSIHNGAACAPTISSALKTKVLKKTIVKISLNDSTNKQKPAFKTGTSRNRSILNAKTTVNNTHRSQKSKSQCSKYPAKLSIPAKSFVKSASRKSIQIMEDIMKSYDQAEKLLKEYRDTPVVRAFEEIQKKDREKKLLKESSKKIIKLGNKEKPLFTWRQKAVLEYKKVFYIIQEKAAKFIQKEYRKYKNRIK